MLGYSQMSVTTGNYYRGVPHHSFLLSISVLFRDNQSTHVMIFCWDMISNLHFHYYIEEGQFTLIRLSDQFTMSTCSDPQYPQSDDTLPFQIGIKGKVINTLQLNLNLSEGALSHYIP